MDKMGSKIAQGLNINTIDTINTATQPRTSSSRCQLSTRSLSEFPSLSL